MKTKAILLFDVQVQFFYGYERKEEKLAAVPCPCPLIFFNAFGKESKLQKKKKADSKSFLFVNGSVVPWPQKI